MDVDQKNGKNLALEVDRKVKMEDEYNLERGLFIPLVKDETKEERANRILSIMEKSNDRLSRVLEIFNRMNR
ncbi:MAG: hypothetical protein VW576_05560 [Opitutae bacterium]